MQNVLAICLKILNVLIFNQFVIYSYKLNNDINKFIFIFQDKKISRKEMVDKHELFAGSQATDYGVVLKKHDEF